MARGPCNHTLSRAARMEGNHATPRRYIPAAQYVPVRLDPHHQRDTVQLLWHGQRRAQSSRRDHPRSSLTERACPRSRQTDEAATPSVPDERQTRQNWSCFNVPLGKENDYLGDRFHSRSGSLASNRRQCVTARYHHDLRRHSLRCRHRWSCGQVAKSPKQACGGPANADHSERAALGRVSTRDERENAIGQESSHGQ